MFSRALGFALLVVVSLVVMPAAAPAVPQDCGAEKPSIVSGAVPKAIGKGPVWLTAESIPIKWKDAGTPVQLIWMSDATARGPVYVTGKHRDTGAQVKFTKLGDIVGKREVRWRLDPLGYQPSQAKPADYKKYNFDRTYGWFPATGCYEITGQIGTQKGSMFLQVMNVRAGTTP